MVVDLQWKMLFFSWTHALCCAIDFFGMKYWKYAFMFRFTEPLSHCINFKTGFFKRLFYALMVPWKGHFMQAYFLKFFAYQWLTYNSSMIGLFVECNEKQQCFIGKYLSMNNWSHSDFKSITHTLPGDQVSPKKGYKLFTSREAVGHVMV